MSDLGDMIVAHLAKRLIAAVLIAAIFFVGIGFVIGRYL